MIKSIPTAQIKSIDYAIQVLAHFRDRTVSYKVRQKVNANMESLRKAKTSLCKCKYALESGKFDF